MGAAGQTTQILIDMSEGDRSAADRLVPLVYDELRALADRFMRQERRSHTLQATALAHEAYLRLVDQSRIDWKGRAHFLAVAAESIRRVLVDHARRHHAAKRGGGRPKVGLTDQDVEAPSIEADVLALEEALEELGRLNDRHRRVVELRFFGGLNVPETAHVLGVSPETVRVDWRMARAWLQQRLR